MNTSPPESPSPRSLFPDEEIKPAARKKANKTLLLGIWLAMLVGLVGLIVVGNIIMNRQPPGMPPPKPMPQMDAGKMAAQWPQIMAHAVAPARGQADTPYTLAEFGDFQCPQCGKARPLLEKMLAQYPTQFNLIFLHRPFSQMHQWAIPAGAASEIAAAQGKFWPMYDALYAHQTDLETGYYGDYAAQAGLDKADFKKAFDAGQGIDRMKTATAFADSLGIEVTPTILVHDNKTGSVKIYVGVDGTKQADGSLQYPGVKALVAQPPWGK